MWWILITTPGRNQVTCELLSCAPPCVRASDDRPEAVTGAQRLLKAGIRRPNAYVAAIPAFASQVAPSLHEITATRLIPPRRVIGRRPRLKTSIASRQLPPLKTGDPACCQSWLLKMAY